MISLDIQHIAQILGGRVSPSGATGMVTGFSTDSRTLKPGELFIPLRGPNYDGHDFLMRALRNGAAACLSEEVVAGFPIPVIQVSDTLVALGNLAASLRSEFSGPVVALTGSTGKTTTKEMLASILELTGEGLKTEGNFNNLIGLPLTLFRLNEQHHWIVLEMGMSARGEISRLAEIAAPNIGVVTNVGPAHLENLQSLDGVVRAKGELFAALKPGGTALVNIDDKRVAKLPVANGVKRLCFGLSAEAEIRAENVLASGEAVSFDLWLPGCEKRAVRLHIAGRHNVYNALAAAGVAYALGVDSDLVVQGLKAFRPTQGRMEVIPLLNGSMILNDSYNANPLSVKAALETLDEMGGEGRRIAVLGDMLELGETAAELHREVGEEAARRVDLLLVMGEMAASLAAGARDAGMPDEAIRVVDSHQAAADLLRQGMQAEDRILIKGSRGMKMEKVAAALCETEPCMAEGHC